MEQDINIAIEQYKQSLIDITNQSGLPIGIIKYVFNDLNTEIAAEYDQYMRQKMQERQAAAAAAEKEATPAEPIEGEVED